MAKAKNLIPDIMKLLGLQMGELFHVVINGCENKLATYYFEDDGLVYVIPNDNEPRPASDKTIIGLIYGGYEVKKLPWVPRIGQDYWCVIPSSDPDYPRTALVTMNKSLFSMINLYFGNFYETQEEAEADKNRFIKELKDRLTIEALKMIFGKEAAKER